ncbi:MAG: hypothetical protein A2277_08845 [Desulfobacterales bacterium RIFOXYA12_FULL_46_15]|nr:MAG: hypothetical protein A2277_08845 [Desulfobacterales bacterium RIFOXYA12_FULL_46_15]
MRVAGFLIGIILCAAQVLAGEYDFAIPEARKKSYELGGRLESRYIYHQLDEDSARYKLTYFQDDPGAATHEWKESVELSAALQKGIFQAVLLTRHEFSDTWAENEWTHDVYEGYVSLRPAPSLTLDAGKKQVSWGKGYAWNPAGFINPSKDPDDPGLSLEGRVQLGMDLIKSFETGALANAGLTFLMLPVKDDWANTDIGEDGDVNLALKLYLLWQDIDLDFIFFDGPDQPQSFGFDFAKNLSENIEIHGELALRKDVSRLTLDETGNTRQTKENPLDFLLGVRWLNTVDTTFIAEYYHQGAGYDKEETEDFFIYQEEAFSQWLSSRNASVMQQAALKTRPYYSQGNFGKDYLYLKISQKEPFDILYFTPYIATIVNLRDSSFNLQPGLTFTPVTNFEFNFRVGIPLGSDNTEFGEKPDAFRPEIWVRYYF